MSAQICWLKARRGWSERETVAHEGRVENVGLVELSNLEEMRRGLSSAGREALDTILAEASDLPEERAPPKVSSSSVLACRQQARRWYQREMSSNVHHSSGLGFSSSASSFSARACHTASSCAGSMTRFRETA